MSAESNIALADQVLAEKTKSRAEKGEVIGGGYFVGTRKSDGRLNWSKQPFEHPTRDAAIAEATRLSETSPGKQFVILAAIGGVLNDKVSP